MEPTLTLARRFWAAIEPIHAIVYFAAEPVEAARKVGLRGFWMGYFAGRVGPLGAVPAEASWFAFAVSAGNATAGVRQFLTRQRH